MPVHRTTRKLPLGPATPRLWPWATRPAQGETKSLRWLQLELGQRVDDFESAHRHRDDAAHKVDDVRRIDLLGRPAVRVVDDARRLVRAHAPRVHNPPDGGPRAEFVVVSALRDAF